MVDLHSLFTIASIVIGFVSAICFCNDAMSVKSEDIALASATIVGGNPAQIKSLSAQRAQYIVGAIFLTFSFLLQAVVVLTPKESQIPLPPFFQLPPVQILTILLAASAVAFLAISKITKLTEKAARRNLQKMIDQQNQRNRRDCKP